MPERAREVFDILEEELRNHAGVELHLEKTRVFNFAGEDPPRLRELGPDVWAGNQARPVHQQGVKVLGTPVGTDAFVDALSDKRLAEERRFWDLLPTLPDLQAAWLLLLYCASPRCNYFARTLPPSKGRYYAEGHDDGMWRTLCRLLGREEVERAALPTQAALATLPMRLGGLGLRSAARAKPAAYWASWADALPTLAQRCPAAARQVVDALQTDTPTAACLLELRNDRWLLEGEGWDECPDWEALLGGLRPTTLQEDGEPGEYKHGLQHEAASRRETFFRRRSLRPLVDNLRCTLTLAVWQVCRLTALPDRLETKW